LDFPKTSSRDCDVRHPLQYRRRLGLPSLACESGAQGLAELVTNANF
jgi:hypothetical protein